MENRSVQERISVVKPENDDRLYRGLKLANGLKVLLISDPTAEKAAAALDICACDCRPTAESSYVPNEVYLYQGLLCLINEDMYQRFFKTYVEKNDGNVSTDIQMEFATYRFDINPSKFKNALTHFADFFNKPPVFSVTNDISTNKIFNIMRECGHFKIDKWSTMKFIKSIRYKLHERPQQKYTVIYDKETKVEKINEMVEKMDNKEIMKSFYDRFYSADVIKLCVLAKESLDELEDLVVRLFSSVKKINRKFVPCAQRRHACISMSPDSVYKICYVPNERNKFYTQQHIREYYKDYNRLHIVFYLQHKIYYALEHFFAYLFEYDGKGSLLSALKAKDWGKFIEVGLLPEANKSNIIVTIHLTTEGVEHVDDIMTLYFKYLNELEKSDEFTLRQSYNEYKKIQELKYRFEEKESSLKYVTRIVQTMQKWPLTYVLCRKHSFSFEWNREPVQQIIEAFLSPQCMNIYVASKKYETITDSISCRFKYKIEKVPAETCATWNKTYSPTEFHIPACNEFIPTMTNIKPDEDNVGNFPTIIKNTDLLKLWHKKDDKFYKPTAIMIFHFVSPIVSLDPFNAHSMLMFVRLINKSLSEYVYPTALVGLYWDLRATDKGIQLKITGFDNKQHLLLEKIMDQMINFKLNPSTFQEERIKLQDLMVCEKELENFYNFTEERAKHYLSLLLTDHMLEKEKIFNVSHNDVTCEAFQNFISCFFNCMYVEGLIHGNITRTEALDIACIIENKLSHVTPAKLKLDRDIKLRDNHHLIFEKNECDEESEWNDDSYTLVFYQIERQSIKWDVLLDFIQEIINKFCCDLLKVKKGKEEWFTARAGVYRSNEIQGLTVFIRSMCIIDFEDAYKYEDAQNKIDALINTMVEYIANMSRKAFEIIKTFIIDTRYANKPKTLIELSDVFWNEIFNQQYYFDRIDVEINKLYEITWDDLYLFSKKFIDKTIPTLSIHFFNTSQGLSFQPTFMSKYDNIFDDVLSFKNHLQFLHNDVS